jgi:membrane fusion protein, multidrug efflux system
VSGVTKTSSFVARSAVAAALILSMVAGLSACGEKGKREAAVSRPVVQDVEVVVLRPVPRETTAEALGTVRARTTAAVAPQVMGRLTGVAVSEGSEVAAGALLATIDDTTVRAQLSSAEGAVAEAEAAREEADGAVSQAEAGKALAEKTFERFRKLLEGKVVTPQEFDEVEMRRTVAVKELERARQKRAQVSAKISQAKGQAVAARAMLAWTRVIAPFAGVIVEKRADAGSMAIPGVPLFVLEDPRRHRIEVSVSETYLPFLKRGTPVQGILDAEPGKPFSAVVTEVVPAIDPASRTFTVKADLPAGRARSGQSGKVRFAAGKGTVLAVPKRAITRAGGSDGVFTIGARDNVARLSMITLGAEFDDRVEVLSGIEDGARVALSPIDKLSDGARVEVRR